MNKKLLFTLLLTGTTSVGHATDEARLDYYAFLLQTDRKLCSPMQAICTKLP